MTTEEKVNISRERDKLYWAAREAVLKRWAELEGADGWIGKKKHRAESASFTALLDDIENIFNDEN